MVEEKLETNCGQKNQLVIDVEFVRKRKRKGFSERAKALVITSFVLCVARGFPRNSGLLSKLARQAHSIDPGSV